MNNQQQQKKLTQEQKKLTQEQLEKLEKQYWTLSEDLEKFEETFKTPRFKSAPDNVKAQTKRQYDFAKYAIWNTLETLMIHDFLKPDMAKHASGNKFVRLNTKFNIMKYQRVKRWKR